MNIQIGDKIVAFGAVKGTVTHITRKSLFIKRDDGIKGSAWDRSKYAGLWNLLISDCELISTSAISLENE